MSSQLRTSLEANLRASKQQMAEDVRAVQQRLAEVRATAESDDGLISATVGADHDLIELWLDPRVFRTPDSTALANRIVATVRQAVALADEESFGLLRDYLPEKATPDATDLRFDPVLHALAPQPAEGQRR